MSTQVSGTVWILSRNYFTGIRSNYHNLVVGDRSVQKRYWTNKKEAQEYQTECAQHKDEKERRCGITPKEGIGNSKD